jgi:hypothetical protein
LARLAPQRHALESWASSVPPEYDDVGDVGDRLAGDT